MDRVLSIWRQGKSMNEKNIRKNVDDSDAPYKAGMTRIFSVESMS